MSDYPEAGILDRRISLLRAAPSWTTNTYGETAPAAWTTYATVWASIQPISSREVAIAKSFATSVTHRLIIRYRSDVKATDKILFGSRTFVVNGVINPDEQGRSLVIFATELVVTASVL